MNKTWKRVVAFLLAVIVCLSLAACGSKKKTEEQNTDTTPVPTVSPDPAVVESASPTAVPAQQTPPADVGGSADTPEAAEDDLTVELWYDGTVATMLTFMTSTVFQFQVVTSDGSTGGSWTSSDASSASVDENGIVTCWKTGMPKITYTLRNASFTCQLNITEPTVRILFGGQVKTDITLNSIWGFDITLQAEVTPAGTPVTWTSDDATVASVTDSGIVMGKRMGTTTIHAKCGTAEATCVIRITENPPTYAAPTPDVSDGQPHLVIVYWGVPNTDFTLSVGTKVQMNYILYNVEGNPAVTWSIKDPEYASVDANGVVTGLKPTAQKDPLHPYTILVATCGDLRCECVVRVKEAAIG